MGRRTLIRDDREPVQYPIPYPDAYGEEGTRSEASERRRRDTPDERSRSRRGHRDVQRLAERDATRTGTGGRKFRCEICHQREPDTSGKTFREHLDSRNHIHMKSLLQNKMWPSAHDGSRTSVVGVDEQVEPRIFRMTGEGRGIYCLACHVTCMDATELLQHQMLPAHYQAIDDVNRRMNCWIPRIYYCHACNIVFGTPEFNGGINYEHHMLTIPHSNPSARQGWNPSWISHVDIRDLKGKAACLWMTDEILMWNEKMLDAEAKYEEAMAMERSHGWPAINSTELKLVLESHQRKLRDLVGRAQFDITHSSTVAAQLSQTKPHLPIHSESGSRYPPRKRSPLLKEKSRGGRRGERGRDGRESRGRRGRDEVDEDMELILSRIKGRDLKKDFNVDAKMKEYLLEELIEKQKKNEAKMNEVLRKLARQKVAYLSDEEKSSEEKEGASVLQSKKKQLEELEKKKKKIEAEMRNIVEESDTLKKSPNESPRKSRSRSPRRSRSRGRDSQYKPGSSSSKEKLTTNGSRPDSSPGTKLGKTGDLFDKEFADQLKSTAALPLVEPQIITYEEEEEKEKDPLRDIRSMMSKKSKILDAMEQMGKQRLLLDEESQLFHKLPTEIEKQAEADAPEIVEDWQSVLKNILKESEDKQKKKHSLMEAVNEAMPQIGNPTAVPRPNMSPKVSEGQRQDFGSLIPTRDIPQQSGLGFSAPPAVQSNYGSLLGKESVESLTSSLLSARNDQAALQSLMKTLLARGALGKAPEPQRRDALLSSLPALDRGSLLGSSPHSDQQRSLLSSALLGQGPVPDRGGLLGSQPSYGERQGILGHQNERGALLSPHLHIGGTPDRSSLLGSQILSGIGSGGGRSSLLVDPQSVPTPSPGSDRGTVLSSQLSSALKQLLEKNTAAAVDSRTERIQEILGLKQSLESARPSSASRDPDPVQTSTNAELTPVPKAPRSFEVLVLPTENLRIPKSKEVIVQVTLDNSFQSNIEDGSSMYFQPCSGTRKIVYVDPAVVSVRRGDGEMLQFHIPLENITDDRISDDILRYMSLGTAWPCKPADLVVARKNRQVPKREPRNLERIAPVEHILSPQEADEFASWIRSVQDIFTDQMLEDDVPDEDAVAWGYYTHPSLRAYTADQLLQAFWVHWNSFCGRPSPWSKSTVTVEVEGEDPGIVKTGMDYRGLTWDSEIKERHTNSPFLFTEWREKLMKGTFYTLLKVSSGYVSTRLLAMIDPAYCVLGKRILVVSSKFIYHIGHLRNLFQLLRDWGVTLKPEESFFAKKSLVFLGYVYSDHCCTPDQELINILDDMPPLRNLAEAQLVSKVLSCYQIVIHAFKELVEPLKRFSAVSRGIKGDPVKFEEWDEGCEKVADRVKRKIRTAEPLILPDYDKHMIIQTYFSSKVEGANLLQRNANGFALPVERMSWISQKQKNSSSSLKDRLVPEVRLITFALEKSKVLKTSTRQACIVYTSPVAIQCLSSADIDDPKFDKEREVLKRFDLSLRDRANFGKDCSDAPLSTDAFMHAPTSFNEFMPHPVPPPGSTIQPAPRPPPFDLDMDPSTRYIGEQALDQRITDPFYEKPFPVGPPAPALPMERERSPQRFIHGPDESLEETWRHPETRAETSEGAAGKSESWRSYREDELDSLVQQQLQATQIHQTRNPGFESWRRPDIERPFESPDVPLHLISGRGYPQFQGPSGSDPAISGINQYLDAVIRASGAPQAPSGTNDPQGRIAPPSIPRIQDGNPMYPY